MRRTLRHAPTKRCERLRSACQLSMGIWRLQGLLHCRRVTEGLGERLVVLLAAQRGCCLLLRRRRHQLVCRWTCCVPASPDALTQMEVSAHLFCAPVPADDVIHIAHCTAGTCLLRVRCRPQTEVMLPAGAAPDGSCCCYSAAPAPPSNHSCPLQSAADGGVGGSAAWRQAHACRQLRHGDDFRASVPSILKKGKCDAKRPD